MHKELLISIISLCNKLLAYFDNDEYEIRVRKGLVNTGDELAKLTHPLICDLIKCWKENKPYVPREKTKWKTIDYIEHYCRKWKADRDNLT